jgi:hypothetical protein
VTEGAREQGRGVGGIGHRTAAWLAWSMCMLSLALTAASLLLLALNRSDPNAHIFDHWVENTILAVGLSTVGAVVAPRCHPQNPIGWLFCVVGLLYAAVHFAAQYAIYAILAAPGSLPAGEAAAWIYSWLFVPQLGLTGLLVLLFPDGQMPSPRWRRFVWFGAFATSAAAVMAAFSSGEINVGLSPIYNPLGIEGMPNVYKPVEGLVLSLLLVAGSAQLVRLRRARGVERQQIKWFAYAAVAGASGAILTYTIPVAIDVPWLERVGFVPFVVGVVSVPISMGIAILRYRLYEIDLIINRTLVYVTLTVTLALVYLGGVALTQGLFQALAGQERQPQLAVVVSTLVIAALFNPLRRRIHGFIDRRFYRRKYDAAKTLEAFSAKLRDETDLDTLSDDLVGVVRETMQPAHVSLWLRPDTPTKGEPAD